jgi:hypothetical protein
MKLKSKPIAYKTRKWAFMLREDIMDATYPDQVYLRRWRLIQMPLFGLYIHHIFLPDKDRDPHDHPWPFVTMILRGGYDERVYENPDRALTHLKIWDQFSVHRFRTSWAHQILTIRPNTFTLVLTGRRRRVWGFWTDEGWVRWQDYNALKRLQNEDLDPFEV